MTVSRRLRAAVPVLAAVAATSLTLAASPAASAAAPAAQKWRVAQVDHDRYYDAWTSVAAVAAGDVWAGGMKPYDGEDDTGQAYAGHWDGHAWRTWGLDTGADTTGVAVAARPADAPSGASTAVAAWKDDDGSVHAAEGTERGWSASPAAGLAPYRGGIAVTPQATWALGTYHSVAVLGQYDEAWTRRRAITTGYLYDLAATTHTDVWVVGDSHDDPYAHRPPTWSPIAAHYDGTRWTTTPVPAKNCHLTSVADPAPGDAWTVCVAYDHHALTVLHWTGGSWHVASATAPALGIGDRPRIAATPDGEVWLVNGDRHVAHWTGSAWQTATLPLPQAPGKVDDAAAADVAWVPGTASGAFAAGVSVYRASEGDDALPQYQTVWRTP